MNQTITHSSTEAQIDIHEKQVVILFPNRPVVIFSLDIPDIRCAGYLPTYTRMGWLWCAYNSALFTEGIELEEGCNLNLFQEIRARVGNLSNDSPDFLSTHPADRV